MKFFYTTILLVIIPLSITAQSNKIQAAIKTIEDLSFDEDTYGVSKVEVDYDEVTKKITITRSFFLSEDNNGTYKSTFYVEDLNKSTFEAETSSMLDGYSVFIRIKTHGKNVEFWTKDMDKSKFFKPIVKTEFIDVINLSNNKILPQSFASKYLDSVKILLGLDNGN